ncbi:MAG: tRNA-intron lyase [Candidatus Woesearchaeota archaeon]|nr:tRNA-intron lyase [Candidatus Woesearchaeota archaeon]
MSEYRIKAVFSREKVFAEETNESRELYEQSRFGELKEGKIQYSLVEGLYLLEKKKLDIIDNKNKKIKQEDYIKKAKKVEPNFWVRYHVYRDIRNRGYIIKTALKFGADFRVYDRGIKPGEDHAKWIVFPVNEGETLTWYDFSAKNRVAHSTRKRLLLAIVDDEGDVTYYEVRWVRP